MTFLAAAPKMNDQVRSVEQPEMFAHRLAAHVQMLAKLAQGLAISVVQSVEQGSPASVGQGFENDIHKCAPFMQPNGCMSRRTKCFARRMASEMRTVPLHSTAGKPSFLVHQGKTGLALGTR